MKSFVFPSFAWAPAALGLLLAASPAVQAAKLKMPLNDTGANLCLNTSTNQFTTQCAGTGQDGETGRDVTSKSAADGRLGFSYQKVCNSGELAGVGACPADPVLGTAATDWGCTKDKVTGLIWEIKTDSGLRGRSGDASAFVAAVNAQGLCGATNWRLPTQVELQGLVDYSVTSPPTINTQWFPSTGGVYWTADRLKGGAANAWVVQFFDGSVVYYYRYYYNAVRLVRASQ